MMTPDLTLLTPLPQPNLQTKTAPSSEAATAQTTGDETSMKQVAQNFEAAFIAQMLTHSGLADAMTSGEGKMASAFGSFYIEELATQMAGDGGLGLADSIYSQLKQYDSDGEAS